MIHYDKMIVPHPRKGLQYVSQSFYKFTNRKTKSGDVAYWKRRHNLIPEINYRLNNQLPQSEETPEI